MNNLKVDYDTYVAEIESILSEIKDTFLIKGKEYVRNNDPFHNFNKSATRRGITPEEVLLGFAEKHFVSIDDLIGDISKGQKVSHSAVKEKTNDIIVYMMILQAMSFVRNNSCKEVNSVMSQIILTEDQVVKLRAGKTSRRGGREYSDDPNVESLLNRDLKLFIQERIDYYEKELRDRLATIENTKMDKDKKQLYLNQVERLKSVLVELDTLNSFSVEY